ncbi:MAG: IS4 family transposase [Gammaproteobacteria bacterium]|nr:IS4 family transposase [Gammaproteobacteria bacterium]
MNAWIDDEFATLDLNDLRLDKRARRILDRFASKPSLSIPAACDGQEAEREAAYRFFDNDKVDDFEILRAHRHATVQRMAAYPVVLLAQDTTEFDFTRPNEVVAGAGPLTSETRLGFHTHVQVAFTPARLCLGTIDADTWGRDPGEFGKRRQKRTKPIQAKESFRWVQGYERACEVAEQLPNTQVVSVGDAESDIYECFGAVLSAEPKRKADWVIRAGQFDRLLAPNEEHRQLQQALQHRRALGSFDMKITTKEGRSARDAKMVVRSATVTLKPPPRPGTQPRLPQVTINVVWVREANPPAGEDPVEWMLLTSLPVETFEQACLVADYYACRWQIEIYFKVLKSGCQIEKLQLETAERIKPCLALYMIVGWRVLYATMLGRNCPELSCEVIFSAAEWKAVWTVQKQEPLPSQAPSLGVFMKLVGELGGHTGQTWDGPLGPKRLWIGLQRTTDFGHAWRLFGPEAAPARARKSAPAKESGAASV